MSGYQISLFYTWSSLVSFKSRLAPSTIGKTSKITIFMNFGQKYTKHELNDPMVVAMVMWKLMKLSIIDFILCIKLMASVLKLIGAGHRGINWQQSMTFNDFQANDLWKWPRDPLSVATWTWKLLHCFQIYLSCTWSSLQLFKSCLALTIKGSMTKITILINFGQKYTKNELSDPW